MTTLRDIPRSVRWTVPLSLLGLALAVPFSAPDGTGMQWDELVLGGVAAARGRRRPQDLTVDDVAARLAVPAV